MNISLEQYLLLIGYSGHAYVVAEVAQKQGWSLAGYCDKQEKEFNPFGLAYFQEETSLEALALLETADYFVAIGDNRIRQIVASNLCQKTGKNAAILIHPSAKIGFQVFIKSGTLICPGVIINPLAQIGAGAICNSGCIIEHECIIGDYAHIAPGAVLAGNVKVGNGTFIGANTVVKQGIEIGQNAVIGAGSVIIKPVPDNAVVAGNPGRQIKNNTPTQ
jgi:sugar O-acyltransferase (sialic acid O-acetyltransferase NeuD family)